MTEHQKAAYQRMHLGPCCRFPASVAVALAMTRPGPHRYISETQPSPGGMRKVLLKVLSKPTGSLNSLNMNGKNLP